MTTYKEIKGTNIEAVASDPSNPLEGQVWFNTASNALKGYAGTVVDAWSTGNSMNTGRRDMGSAGAAAQTAALAFGGVNSINNTEAYNGTNWTEVNNLNTARKYIAGFGTQTAAIAAAGGFPANGKTEQFNGSVWAAKNTMGVATYSRRGAGNITNGLVWGGTQSSRATCEEWNPEDALAIF